MQISDNQYNTFMPLLKTLGMTESKKKIQEAKGLFESIHFVTLLSGWALREFKTQNYVKFDALVGETSCQIRASKIADLAKTYLKDSNFRAEVDSTLSYFENALERIKTIKAQFNKCVYSQKDFNKLFPKGISFLNFCEKFNFKLNFSSKLGFIVQSYFLQEIKGEKESAYPLFYCTKEFTTIDELFDKCKMQGNQISSNMLNKLIGEAQRCVAQSSVNYLFDKLKEWPEGNEKNALTHLLKVNTTKDDFDRSCTPCFYNMAVIFRNIHEQNHPFVVHICRWTEKGKYIDSINRVYRSKGDGKNFVFNQKPLEDNAPVIFLHAVSVDQENEHLSQADYVKKLTSWNLADLLDANWAQHTQLPGKKNQWVELPPDQNKDSLEKMAHEIGCSNTNKKLFLAIHMYCESYKESTRKSLML